MNAAIRDIFQFPEVRAITKQITKSTSGKHSASIMASDGFGNDSSFYGLKVGNNSDDDQYVNIFTFPLEKKSGELKVYEPLNDSIISLKDWRKRLQRPQILS